MTRIVTFESFQHDIALHQKSTSAHITPKQWLFYHMPLMVFKHRYQREIASSQWQRLRPLSHQDLPNSADKYTIMILHANCYCLYLPRTTHLLDQLLEASETRVPWENHHITSSHWQLPHINSSHACVQVNGGGGI